MTVTLSQPVRIAAICGLAFTVLVFGGLRMLGGKSGGGTEASVAPKIIRHHKFGPGAKAATPKATATAPTTRKAGKASAPTKRAAAKATHVTPRATVDVAAIKAARDAGLPESLALALGRYPTVVISLYDPYSQVDGTAFAEAKAGAALAGVGFVPLSVLSQRDVGTLTQQLGLLPDPGVMVYVRPGTLAAKIAGFADKETVAQAAENAAASS